MDNCSLLETKGVLITAAVQGARVAVNQYQTSRRMQALLEVGTIQFQALNVLNCHQERMEVQLMEAQSAVETDLKKPNSKLNRHASVILSSERPHLGSWFIK